MSVRRRLAVAATAVSATAVASFAASAAPAAGAAGLHFVGPIKVTTSRTAWHMSQSGNWSGYNQGALYSTTSPQQFKSISGTWTVPKATQHTKGQAEYSATWVGIGGGCVTSNCDVTDSTLIQAGTEQDVAANGAASYSAWWEIIPEPSTAVSLTVHPGDLVKVSITSSDEELWSIVIADETTHKTVTVSTPYSSDYSTAEWIVETPLVVSGTSSGVAAMPNLGRVHFDNATVNGKSAGLAAIDELQLSPSSGVILATPSGPDSDHDGFNDCTYATSCPKPTTS